MAEQEEKKWVIFYGTVNQPIPELEDEEMAEDEANLSAWQKACDDYESYVGLHGLRTVQDIMEEDEIEDEEEASTIYDDERESWLNYWVEEYDPEKHDKILEE